MSEVERWRISKHPERNNAIFGPDTQGLVPVVPCDDAAMERATAAIIATHEDELRAFLAGETEANTWRPEKYAEAAFRAAGETP